MKKEKKFFRFQLVESLLYQIGKAASMSVVGIHSASFFQFYSSPLQNQCLHEQQNCCHFLLKHKHYESQGIELFLIFYFRSGEEVLQSFQTFVLYTFLPARKMDFRFPGKVRILNVFHIHLFQYTLKKGYNTSFYS